jgi:hypothetical protein
MGGIIVLDVRTVETETQFLDLKIQRKNRDNKGTINEITEF